MAYSTSNPPELMFPSMGENQPALWVYSSTDAHTDVDATDYFTDAEDRGIRAGDVMIVIDTSTPTCTIHYVSAIDADGNGTIAAATLA